MQNPSRVAAFALVALVALGACAQRSLGGGPSLAELRGLGADVSLATRSAPMEGVSAGDVIGTPLRAEDGTSLGRVSDLVVGPDGRIEAVVVSSGGSEASVPWNAIRADDGTLVVAAGARPTGFAPPTGSWRAAAVMERMVSIQDGRPYGVVSDLVFDGDGALRQVLVTPDATEGVRYPVDHPFQEIGADYVPGLGPGSVDD